MITFVGIAALVMIAAVAIGIFYFAGNRKTSNMGSGPNPETKVGHAAPRTVGREA